MVLLLHRDGKALQAEYGNYLFYFQDLFRCIFTGQDLTK